MSKAVIHDHSDKAVVNEKGQKVNLSIEEYRGLIE
jgi:hypothetical protein